MLALGVSDGLVEGVESDGGVAEGIATHVATFFFSHSDHLTPPLNNLPPQTTLHTFQQHRLNIFVAIHGRRLSQTTHHKPLQLTQPPITWYLLQHLIGVKLHLVFVE